MRTLRSAEGVHYHVSLKFNYVYDKFDMWMIKTFHVVVMSLTRFYWSMEAGESERK